MTTKTPGRQIIEMIRKELEEVLKEGIGTLGTWSTESAHPNAEKSAMQRAGVYKNQRS